MDPLVFFLALTRALGCFGHFALALSYAGIFDRWAGTPARVVGTAALVIAEALSRLLGL